MGVAVRKNEMEREEIQYYLSEETQDGFEPLRLLLERQAHV